MNQADFVTALEMELQLRGTAFDRADLEEFVRSCWPLILDDCDVPRWADAFLETGAVGRVVGTEAGRPFTLPPAVAYLYDHASPTIRRYLAETMEDRDMDWIEAHAGLLQSQAEYIDSLGNGPLVNHGTEAAHTNHFPSRPEVHHARTRRHETPGSRLEGGPDPQAPRSRPESRPDQETAVGRGEGGIDPQAAGGGTEGGSYP